MMGFFSSVCSFVSNVVSTVSNAISSIGSSLVNSATTLLSVAGKYLGPISTIVQIVGTLLGVLKPDDNIEELGAKAMQPDSKSPEEFSSNAEYIDYLKEDVKLDKAKFDKATEIEKAARTAVGTTIVSKGIEEQKGFDIPITTWVSMAKLNLENKSEEIDKLLETFKDGNLEDFSKYVDGKLDIKKEGEIGDTLVEMYKELEPNKSIEEIEAKVINMDKGAN